MTDTKMLAVLYFNCSLVVVFCFHSRASVHLLRRESIVVQHTHTPLHLSSPRLPFFFLVSRAYTNRHRGDSLCYCACLAPREHVNPTYGDASLLTPLLCTGHTTMERRYDRHTNAHLCNLFLFLTLRCDRYLPIHVAISHFKTQSA